MKDKNNIEELFRKGLENYQAEVNPNLWNGIQAGISGAGAAGAGAGTAIGLTGKIIIGAVVVAGITVGSIALFNSDKEQKAPEKQEIIQVEETTQDTLQKGEEKEEIQFAETDTLRNEGKEKKDAETIDIEKLTIYCGETLSEDQSEENTSSNQSAENKGKNVDINKIISPTETAKVPSDDPIVGTIDTNDESEEKEEPSQEKIEVSIAIAKQENQFITLKAEDVPEEATVFWDFGDGNYSNSLRPEHFYKDAGNYTIRMTAETETQQWTKSVDVNVQLQGKFIDLPNVFTPNGDGDNDEFYIKSKHIEEFHITILDEKQNVVFSSTNPDFIWKGTDPSGKAVKEGNYYYIIVAKDEAGNSINEHRRLRLHR